MGYMIGVRHGRAVLGTARRLWSVTGLDVWSGRQAGAGEPGHQLLLALAGAQSVQLSPFRARRRLLLEPQGAAL